MKKIILLLTVMSLSFSCLLFALSEKCESGNCKNGSGTLVIHDEGKKYTGQFKNGLYHGKGTLEYDKNGYSIYTGEFRDGKQHGKGILILSNGDRYEGDFKNGKPSGKGTCFYKNGTKYTGELNEFGYNGKGILYNADGSVKLDGTWSNGVFTKQQTRRPPAAAL